MLFSRQHWRITLFASGFWFCAVTPYFAIATFADGVLEKYGLSGGIAGGVGLSALAAAGVVVTVLLIDKLGRRVLTVPPQWLCTVFLAVLGLWVGAPAMVVLALFLAFSFFNAGYNTLTGHLPGRGLPDRGSRDRDGLRGRRQPDRGRPGHVPAGRGP
jgi:MFS transporter, putative metabolite transport protein